MASLVLTLSASFAAAAETAKGTVKKVDDKAATITFARDGGKDEVLPVDKSVDLKKVKPNTKAQITVDGGVVKAINPMPRAAGY